MKQSSIEWFAEKMVNPYITPAEFNEILRKAKEMHKEEIENAHLNGRVEEGRIRQRNL